VFRKPIHKQVDENLMHRNLFIKNCDPANADYVGFFFYFATI